MTDYAIVPKEPTEEMRIRGARAIRDTMDNCPNFAERARQCHERMLEARDREVEKLVVRALKEAVAVRETEWRSKAYGLPGSLEDAIDALLSHPAGKSLMGEDDGQA